MDLNGDGLDDIVVVLDHEIVWYPSIGKDGYDVPRRFLRPKDEDTGPSYGFKSGPWARHLAVGVFLADMTGDGLLDVVSVRPSGLVYWPNKGNGKFGVRIVMTPPEGDFLLETTYGAFDPARVRFADLDGSGTADLVYAGANGLHILIGNNSRLRDPE